MRTELRDDGVSAGFSHGFRAPTELGCDGPSTKVRRFPEDKSLAQGTFECGGHGFLVLLGPISIGPPVPSVLLCQRSKAGPNE